jgi:hypothetical protein
MKAVVTGMIATYPVGGVAWDYAQYALGLEQLGFEVFYLEDTGLPTYDPSRGEYGDDPSYGVRFLAESLMGMSSGMAQRWFFRDHQGATHGLEPERLARVVAEADLFLNVSGSVLLRPEYLANRCKVLIDTDPGYNHFVNYPKWDAQPCWGDALGYRAHDHFFTYALNLGQPDCHLPDLGLPWQPTVPLVVLDRWRPEPPGTVWTTVLTWNNFQKPIEAKGVLYGTKEREFERVEILPQQVSVPLEMAVGGSAPPRHRWRSLGWSVVDSENRSRTIDSYRSYIQGSRGEFSVAKNVYVATRSGWFSCRSVCYLAAGRPVVVQDTGFSKFLPTGEGLLAFSTLQEAVTHLGDVERNYDRHAESALDLARTHFDARIVLGDLLERIGLTGGI